MLKVLAAILTFALATLFTLAINDAALSATLLTEVSEGHRRISAELFTAALSFRSDDSFERLLMGILAAGAFGFYFRRKYQTSERDWQRIIPAESTSSEPLFRSSLQR